MSSEEKVHVRVFNRDSKYGLLQYWTTFGELSCDQIYLKCSKVTSYTNFVVILNGFEINDKTLQSESVTDWCERQTLDLQIWDTEEFAYQARIDTLHIGRCTRYVEKDIRKKKELFKKKEFEKSIHKKMSDKK